MENVGTADFTDMGLLEGHSDWVTCIATGNSQKEGEDSDVLVSGSRDRTVIIWKTFGSNNDGFYGVPYRSLTGHNHFVSDISLSQENAFLISSSWDKTLRLWDLRTGQTRQRFTGHTKEIFTCSFSPDNRQIISSGADKTIKLWNSLADCKFTSEANNHTDWVSAVRYSPVLKSNPKNNFQPYFTSVGWDGKLKVWNTNFQIRYTFKPHDGNVNSVAISPNGKYLATGGKDKILNIWDITDLKEPIRTIDAGCQINQICFNPKLQWVSAATDNGVKIWDLMNDNDTPIGQMNAEIVNKNNKQVSSKKAKTPICNTLTWNALGRKLFAGFTDGYIRVWHVATDQK